MPPAATCCLLQTTRRHCKRRLTRHGSRRFPTLFCSMETAEFSIKLWAAWISLNCGGQFWPTSPRITSASTNTGRLVPGKKTRRRVAADKIVRETRETQFSFLENQEPVLAVQEFTGNGSPKTYARDFHLQPTQPSETRWSVICHCCSLRFLFPCH